MTWCFILPFQLFIFFFFNDTATTEIYTLSLHDALPISCQPGLLGGARQCEGHGAQLLQPGRPCVLQPGRHQDRGDRKSTRLNSSHSQISYAVFCLKKKKKKTELEHLSEAYPNSINGSMR